MIHTPFAVGTDRSDYRILENACQETHWEDASLWWKTDGWIRIRFGDWCGCI